jgi:hypothetical protein
MTVMNSDREFMDCVREVLGKKPLSSPKGRWTR